jgi:hypothetical protein
MRTSGTVHDSDSAAVHRQAIVTIAIHFNCAERANVH